MKLDQDGIEAAAKVIHDDHLCADEHADFSSDHEAGAWCIDCATAALTAYHQHLEATGRVIVPKEEAYPFGCSLDEMDLEAFFNLRGWLENALKENGAHILGAGIGLGQADVCIELEGAKYSISATPLPIQAAQEDD